MAIYDETSSGGAVLGGCASLVYLKTYITAFGVGDIVYSLPKAKRGVLEKVVIKRLKVLSEQRTGGVFQVMYVDTLNALWNEWDLVSHAEAIAIAKAYYEDLLALAQSLKTC